MQTSVLCHQKGKRLHFPDYSLLLGLGVRIHLPLYHLENPVSLRHGQARDRISPPVSCVRTCRRDCVYVQSPTTLLTKLKLETLFLIKMMCPNVFGKR